MISVQDEKIYNKCDCLSGFGQSDLSHFVHNFLYTRTYLPRYLGITSNLIQAEKSLRHTKFEFSWAPLRGNTFRYHWLCRAASEAVEHLPLCWMYQALGGRRCQRPHEVMGSNPGAGRVFFKRTLLNTDPPLAEVLFCWWQSQIEHLQAKRDGSKIA